MSMSSVSEMQNLRLLSGLALSGLKWYEKYKAKSGELILLVKYLSSHGTIDFTAAGAAPGNLPEETAETINSAYKRLRQQLVELQKEEISESAIRIAKTNLEILRNCTGSAILLVTNSG
jgi:hypothetical protein